MKKSKRIRPKEELRTNNGFRGYLKNRILSDSIRMGMKPGCVVKEIVEQYYREKGK